MIGTVIERRSDDFVVDIGGPFAAVLNTLAFEGATRRNRPKLVEGDLVYARVVFAHKDTGHRADLLGGHWEGGSLTPPCLSCSTPSSCIERTLPPLPGI